MCGVIPPLPHTTSWCDALLNTGYIFLALWLVKHKGNFTFNFTLPCLFSVFLRTSQIQYTAFQDTKNQMLNSQTFLIQIIIALSVNYMSEYNQALS
jgi:hypothetical protein